MSHPLEGLFGGISSHKSGNDGKTFKGYSKKHLCIEFAFNGEGDTYFEVKRKDQICGTGGFQKEHESRIYYNKDSFKEAELLGVNLEEIAKEIERIAYIREHSE